MREYLVNATQKGRQRNERLSWQVYDPKGQLIFDSNQVDAQEQAFRIANLRNKGLYLSTLHENLQVLKKLRSEIEKAGEISSSSLQDLEAQIRKLEEEPLIPGTDPYQGTETESFVDSYYILSSSELAVIKEAKAANLISQNLRQQFAEYYSTEDAMYALQQHYQQRLREESFHILDKNGKTILDCWLEDKTILFLRKED